MQQNPVEIPDPPASGDHAEDASAIERCRQGEIAGLAPLVTRYHTPALRVAYLLTGDRAYAEDIAQEAFLRAFQAAARFQSGRPFLPWFLQIVTNLARQGRRTVARRREISLTRITTFEGAAEAGQTARDAESFHLEVTPLSHAWTPDPVRAAERVEARDAFVAALARLSAKQREVVILRYYLGYGDQEIAVIVGCRPGAARQRLADGLRALERIIRSDYAWLIENDPLRAVATLTNEAPPANLAERRLTHGNA